MPIFHSERHKLSVLFIHIPKTGGGSVEQFFRQNGFSMRLYGKPSQLVCSYQHFHAELLRHVVNLDKINYVFTITRDPLQRLISEYKWMIKTPKAKEGFNAWYQAMRGYRLRDPYTNDNHLRAQTEFILPNTKIFKLEDTLEKAIDTISNDLGITFEQPKIKNEKSYWKQKIIDERPDLEQLFEKTRPNAKTWGMIQSDYGRDYKQLNYKVARETNIGS